MSIEFSREGIIKVFTKTKITIDADAYAYEIHARQKRKDGGPYIDHCLEVQKIAVEIGLYHEINNQNLNVIASAAVLHDSMEDQGCDFEDIQSLTNSSVANLVSMVSDDKRLPSTERLREYLKRIEAGGFELHIIKLADITSNARSGLGLIESSLESVEGRGKGQPPRIFMRNWEKKALTILLACWGLADSPFWQQCKNLLDEIREKVR